MNRNSMASRNNKSLIVSFDDLMLVTGANGFIGTRVIRALLGYGYRNIRCFVHSEKNINYIKSLIMEYPSAKIELLCGNLLSRDDCRRAASGVSVTYHLAAGMDKSFPGAFMNTVVTTRNLMDALVESQCIKRFVNVSSFAVYSNMGNKRGSVLDEACPIEDRFMERHESYVYAKVKQDQIVKEYGKNHSIPWVIIRPGVVFGPGKSEITGRVGLNTFGVFLHLGGSNKIPFIYVDNCAEAIAKVGLVAGIDGEVFNVVDDDLPTSRQFLRMYKSKVKTFFSIYIPYRVFHALCFLWEKYSRWSRGQLPPVFNRRRSSAYWKGNRYNNEKIKELTGWKPTVPLEDAFQRYFEYQKRTTKTNA
jgi:nucleoside-diphosphate-sugar epimerase